MKQPCSRRLLKRCLIFTLFILANASNFAQPIHLSLHITNTAGSSVPDAGVTINQKRIKADSNGTTSVFLVPGNYIINITSVDHYPMLINTSLKKDTSISFVLRMRQSLMGNVTIVSNRNVTRNQMGIQTISSSQLRKLPVILGEVDPLKTITLLPGIKNGGEASAGIYVRGGGPDQNLVLLDGINIYNPNHLLGFFSIFNGEAVKNVEVIKGGMPAEYGGRLSSVISIDTRDGNKDSLKGSGGVGLISSRFSLEGPIKKNKSSFIISGRRTYIDQLAKLAARKKVGGNGYYFYDINAKADFTVNKNNVLNFIFYTGKDDFSYSNTNERRSVDFNTQWGNTIAGITWKQQLNKKLQQQTAVVYNNFGLDSRFGFSSINFLFSSGLRDYQIKSDWQFASNNWLKIKWGGQYTWHRFTPGAGGFTAGVQEFKSKLTEQFAQEAAVYASTDINITPLLNVIAGMRYSYFNQVGPTEKVVYNNEGVPTGAVERFTKGQSIAQYHYPEPRLSMLYKLPGQASIKISYTRTIQYLHLATTSSATFPSDLWVPSSKFILPAKANQVALGYFKNFKNNLYEFNIETYFKTMNNQVEFKPGAQLFFNQNLDGQMIFGSGRAYGMEIFLQKKRGRLNGWIGYTLSRAERTFSQLNEGKKFAYRYDRTHDISVVANYTLNKKWEAAAVFVYGTGNALTLPTGRYTYNFGYNPNQQELLVTNINQYGKINDYRAPAYHRLDVSFTYTPKPAGQKKFINSWNFGIYNLYNRYNPYFIYLNADESDFTVKAKKVFLFPVIPSVTWNFKF